MRTEPLPTAGANPSNNPHLSATGPGAFTRTGRSIVRQSEPQLNAAASDIESHIVMAFWSVDRSVPIRRGKRHLLRAVSRCRYRRQEK